MFSWKVTEAEGKKWRPARILVAADEKMADVSYWIPGYQTDIDPLAAPVLLQNGAENKVLLDSGRPDGGR